MSALVIAANAARGLGRAWTQSYAARPSKPPPRVLLGSLDERLTEALVQPGANLDVPLPTESERVTWGTRSAAG